MLLCFVPLAFDKQTDPLLWQHKQSYFFFSFALPLFLLYSGKKKERKSHALPLKEAQLTVIISTSKLLSCSLNETFISTISQRALVGRTAIDLVDTWRHFTRRTEPISGSSSYFCLPRHCVHRAASRADTHNPRLCDDLYIQTPLALATRFPRSHRI